MIDDKKLREAIDNWKEGLELIPDISTEEKFYLRYIYWFLDSFIQKVNLYNIYRDTEDGIYIYPLRTLYEMLLKFEYFVKQKRSDRIKISHLELYKYTKSKDDINNVEYDVYLKNYGNTFSKTERDNILKPLRQFRILCKASKIFNEDSYKIMYNMFCGFAHGEIFYTPLDVSNENWGELGYLLTEGLIDCIKKI